MIDTSYGYAFQFSLNSRFTNKFEIDFYNGKYGGYIGELTYRDKTRTIFISKAEVITWQGSIMHLVENKIYEIISIIENTRHV